eukprot:NODE_641_length_1430_cov_412.359273.p1 GENE.NODE_641_length_1430_cov_412.359273~~NODE_641_length_1430_cov_412.359273.p1  ORF type:complete len:398 (+),score=76.80 NODE_641_length_1430_cov_412.359273:117-1310(+)
MEREPCDRNERQGDRGDRREDAHRLAQGLLAQDSKDDALKRYKNQNFVTKYLASKTGWYRSYLVNLFAVTANLGLQLTNAALNEDVYHDLRDYSAKGDAAAPEQVKERMKVWRQNLTAEAAAAYPPPPFEELEQTAVNSFHVENSTGAYWALDGLHLPLGKKIPVYRGQIAQGPLRTFNMASGVAVVEYNQRDQQLEIYFYSNNYLQVFDPMIPDLPPPILYTSALPGEDASSIVPDTRSNSIMQAPSVPLKALYDRYTAIFPDYDYLFRDPAGLCTDEQRRQWALAFQRLDYAKFIHGHGEKPSQIEVLDLVRQMTNAIDCSTSYLQAQVRHSNFYDLMEALGWAHFIMETPSNETTLATAYKHWNEFTYLYPGADPANSEIKPSPRSEAARALLF